jgi:hypothetical protein
VFDLDKYWFDCSEIFRERHSMVSIESKILADLRASDQHSRRHSIKLADIHSGYRGFVK